ncbi:hypothetical protein BDW22DRAFT_722112 [Trametopsis cervina]|nr:hypothetical protein BDW22DRAFT_722112 [Trametopsis cervina]
MQWTYRCPARASEQDDVPCSPAVNLQGPLSHGNCGLSLLETIIPMTPCLPTNYTEFAANTQIVILRGLTSCVTWAGSYNIMHSRQPSAIRYTLRRCPRFKAYNPVHLDPETAGHPSTVSGGDIQECLATTGPFDLLLIYSLVRTQVILRRAPVK